MGDFFKGTRFKVLIGLLIAIFVFTLRATQDGTAVPMLSRATGFVLTPIQRVASQMTYSVGGFFSDFFSAHRIANDNEALKDENAALRQMLIDYETYKTENEQLREYLEIKDRHSDFTFEPAVVIGRNAFDRFSSFTIDKGTLNGVRAGDPVITNEGLIGMVFEVGPTHSTVITILDATLEVGAMDIATREIGITGGTVDLSQKGLLRLSYLPRDSAAKKGDLVVTTGIGGVFPSDLVIGIIDEIIPDGQGLSLYAILDPIADIQTVSHVLVVTSFTGQQTIPSDPE